MMLQNVDKLEPYITRQLLIRFKQDVDNSPHLCETKKRIIEHKLQEIVDVWTTKDFV